ncbi:MAG: citrate synthase, partial [Pseudomonadota bacterium]|nr:citrate synthase [Pseudomonadota bacterium]
MPYTNTLSNKNGDSIELALRHGTAGPSALEISPLHNKKGLLAFDPGFVSTASCESSITYIDGDLGIL